MSVEPTRLLEKFAANLSKAVWCAMLLCCSACLHHRVTLESGFHLSENSGAPMLVPTDGQTPDSGNFQLSMLDLSGRAARTNHQDRRACTINGETFALRSTPPMDSRHWIIRSPSIGGWNTLPGRIDIYGQWKIFTRDIARMAQDGCFPTGLTALQIRIAIAQKISLPAGEVPIFFYSDQGTGFTDLAPGMEIELQKFVHEETSTNARSEDPPRLWTANYEVVPRHSGGVRLKLGRRLHGGANSVSGSEEKELSTLSQHFAQARVLRLFLEGIYGNGKVSNGVLIGASTQTQLDELTDLIHRNDPAKCSNYRATVCVEFTPGAVSLLSVVQLNGRLTPCVYGTSLATLLRSLPQPEQTAALESAHVFRRLNADHYAEIDFQRTETDANQLLLLPEDRVEWRP